MSKITSLKTDLAKVGESMKFSKNHIQTILPNISKSPLKKSIYCMSQFEMYQSLFSEIKQKLRLQLVPTSIPNRLILAKSMDGHKETMKSILVECLSVLKIYKELYEILKDHQEADKKARITLN
jgi:hypothetical protein